MFEEVTGATGIQEPEITNTCINCPNQPLKEESPPVEAKRGTACM
jgi:hypothetical protein